VIKKVQGERLRRDRRLGGYEAVKLEGQALCARYRVWTHKVDWVK
jgi:hypothetical protein